MGQRLLTPVSAHRPNGRDAESHGRPQATLPAAVNLAGLGAQNGTVMPSLEDSMPQKSVATRKMESSSAKMTQRPKLRKRRKKKRKCSAHPKDGTGAELHGLLLGLMPIVLVFPFHWRLR